MKARVICARWAWEVPCIIIEKRTGNRVIRIVYSRGFSASSNIARYSFLFCSLLLVHRVGGLIGLAVLMVRFSKVIIVKFYKILHHY